MSRLVWKFEITEKGNLWIDNGCYDGIMIEPHQFQELKDFLNQIINHGDNHELLPNVGVSAPK